MSMCKAPTAYHIDQWIQYVTDHPVLWISTHHYRLLHTNVLLHILRSPLGTLCQSSGLTQNEKSNFRSIGEATLVNVFSYQRSFLFRAKGRGRIWRTPSSSDPFQSNEMGISTNSSCWISTTILSVNMNGTKTNGHLSIKPTFLKYALCLLVSVIVST